MPRPLSLKQNFNWAANQPPGWREGFFTNEYNNSLRYGFAPATTPEKNGTVVLTHGYGEFIDLYYEAIREYQKMGYDVWAMDFYGFGKSGRDDPENPHTPSTKGMLRHVRDLDYFTKNIVERVPGKPLLMSTHSMGGHIGLMYLQKHPGVFDGAVMSAPMFDIFRFDLPKIFRPVIRSIFNAASFLGLRDTPIPASPAFFNKISHASDAIIHSQAGVRETFNKMMRAALPGTRVDRPTFGWVAKAFSTISRSTTDKALQSVETPILIGSAGIESLVDNNTHEKAARLMPNATLVKLPTAQHGLWFEDNGNYDLWLKNVKAFTGKVTTNYELAHSDSSRIAENAGPEKQAFTAQQNLSI